MPKAFSYVRMSTEAQLAGTSLERQLELSEAYARKHNLDLQDPEQYQDIGVSAYTGDNTEAGAALGRFLSRFETPLTQRYSSMAANDQGKPEIQRMLISVRVANVEMPDVYYLRGFCGSIKVPHILVGGVLYDMTADFSERSLSFAYALLADRLAHNYYPHFFADFGGKPVYTACTLSDLSLDLVNTPANQFAARTMTPSILQKMADKFGAPEIAGDLHRRPVYGGGRYVIRRDGTETIVNINAIGDPQHPYSLQQIRITGNNRGDLIEQAEQQRYAGQLRGKADVKF